MHGHTHTCTHTQKSHIFPASLLQGRLWKTWRTKSHTHSQCLRHAALLMQTESLLQRYSAHTNSLPTRRTLARTHLNTQQSERLLPSHPYERSGTFFSVCIFSLIAALCCSQLFQTVRCVYVCEKGGKAQWDSLKTSFIPPCHCLRPGHSRHAQQ